MIQETPASERDCGMTKEVSNCVQNHIQNCIHTWLYDQFAGFYLCPNCGEEVSQFSLDYYWEGETNPGLVLDKIVENGYNKVEI